jgi:hypothetical protein
MRADPETRARFSMSIEELRRRERAFDRLGLSTVLSLSVCSADLLTKHLAQAATAIGTVGALFLLSRLWLAAGNRRFATTTWSIEPGILCRDDGRSRHQYQLSSIRGVQAKRTTNGVIREIKVTFDAGSPVFVNGLEDPESFRNRLRSLTEMATQTELREPLDFDHPWFYAALGVALGVMTAVIERVLLSGPQVDGRWVYGLLAAYSLGFGVYWLRAKPISGRYGARALAWDRGIALAALVLAVASVFAALMWSLPGGGSA